MRRAPTSGADVVATRISAWWPEPAHRVSLEHSGAQLLKHFIRTVTLPPHEHALDLVCRIADMEWYPYR